VYSTPYWLTTKAIYYLFKFISRLLLETAWSAYNFNLIHLSSIKWWGFFSSCILINNYQWKETRLFIFGINFCFWATDHDKIWSSTKNNSCTIQLHLPRWFLHRGRLLLIDLLSRWITFIEVEFFLSSWIPFHRGRLLWSSIKIVLFNTFDFR